MREEEEELRKMIAVIAFLCVVSLVVWLIFLRVGSETPDVRGINQPAPTPVPTPQHKSRFCMQVKRECSPEAEFPLDGCRKRSAEQRARTEAELRLGNPMQLEVCKSAEKEMASGCPEGCSLAPASVLVVPGKIEISATELEPGTIPRPDGGKPFECLIKAKRNVTVSGTCLQD